MKYLYEELEFELTTEVHAGRVHVRFVNEEHNLTLTAEIESVEVIEKVIDSPSRDASDNLDGRLASQLLKCAERLYMIWQDRKESETARAYLESRLPEMEAVV